MTDIKVFDDDYLLLTIGPLKTFDIQVVEGIDGELVEEDLIDGEMVEEELIDGNLEEEELIDGELVEEELIDGELVEEELIDSDLETGLVEVQVLALPIDLETFTLLTGPSTFEIGQSLVTPSFAATLNKQPTVLAALGDNVPNAVQDVLATPTAFTSPNTYVQTTPNGSIVWTYDVEDDLSSDSKQITRVWRPLVFTGVLAGAGPYTEAEIEALIISVLRGSAAATVNVSPVSQYIVHAYPDSYGPKVPSDFMIGNFGTGDVTEIQTGLSITNGFGETLGYSVARSDNLLTAAGGVAFAVT